MGFVWDAKNNFILLHSIHRHQQESLSLNINWLSIVRDIQLEISSTPIVKSPVSFRLIFCKRLFLALAESI